MADNLKLSGHGSPSLPHAVVPIAYERSALANMWSAEAKQQCRYLTWWVTSFHASTAVVCAVSPTAAGCKQWRKKFWGDQFMPHWCHKRAAYAAATLLHPRMSSTTQLSVWQCWRRVLTMLQWGQHSLMRRSQDVGEPDCTMHLCSTSWILSCRPTLFWVHSCGWSHWLHAST